MPWYPDVLPMVSSPRCEKCTVHQHIFVKLKGHIGVGFADLIGFFRNILYEINISHMGSLMKIWINVFKAQCTNVMTHETDSFHHFLYNTSGHM